MWFMPMELAWSVVVCGTPSDHFRFGDIWVKTHCVPLVTPGEGVGTLQIPGCMDPLIDMWLTGMYGVSMMVLPKEAAVGFWKKVDGGAYARPTVIELEEEETTESRLTDDVARRSRIAKTDIFLIMKRARLRLNRHSDLSSAAHRRGRAPAPG